MSELLSSIESEFGDGRFFDVHDRVVIEVQMLEAAGVTVADFEFAVDRWAKTYRVNENWPFLRTVMWNRRAEIISIQRGEVG